MGPVDWIVMLLILISQLMLGSFLVLKRYTMGYLEVMGNPVCSLLLKSWEKINVCVLHGVGGRIIMEQK